MAGSVLGTAVRRVEDPTLLTGAGLFVEDLRVDDATHAVFVGSTVAHGRVTRIDTAEAEASPGVVAVLTAETLGLGDVFNRFPLDPAFERPVLAGDTVRFVGEQVALVIAESFAQAADAAELVVVEIEPLAARVDVEAAATGPPVVSLERGSDLMFRRFGDVEGLHDDDEVVVTTRIDIARMSSVPLETHGVLAIPDGPDQLTIHVATQGAHGTRAGIAASLGLDESQIRVITPWVGGGFGAKTSVCAEQVAIAQAARLVQRPVAWKERRSENVISMPGRAQLQFARMGFTRAGRITSMEAAVIGDGGAYPQMGLLLPMAATRMMAQNVYAIPKLQFDAGGVVTNTAPVRAFRGAGRPEAAILVELLIALGAAELGIDPAELRRLNFLAPDDFPLTTHTGAAYDSGEYERALDEALRLAGYDDLRAEQQRRRDADDPVMLGIGVACYVEVTAGAGTSEWASVDIDDDGGATVRVGTSSHGHGHATAFAQVVEDRLGIPVAKVRLVQGDTDEVPRGGGTGGSRSLQTGGTAIFRASEAVLERARDVAARLLEANAADIVVAGDGRLGVAGVPTATVGWAELAAASEEGLRAELDVDQGSPTFPFGAHVSVVEVDTETGKVTPLRHIAVDDCGTIVNPMLVQGQQHGGIAAGIGEAIWEEIVHDADGNPQTTNLATYAFPSAAELPSFETANTETPTPRNPLGAKGIGESGTIGSTPAVLGAVLDALGPLGVRHLDLPLTPERVWHAIEVARQTGRYPVDDVSWPDIG